MPLLRTTTRWHRIIEHAVVTGAARDVIALPLRSDGTAALDVQAKLDCLRTKARTPIQRAFRPKIMPFKAHVLGTSCAIKFPPALLQMSPLLKLMCGALEAHRASNYKVGDDKARRASRGLGQCAGRLTVSSRVSATGEGLTTSRSASC